ncbi:Methionine synthase [Alteripontixanthobacter maritimus]|uniref:Methionine synthase n=1 Tax=Alteripontixanthobacter maritimus TaxID=2161824 RepID=A0A369Q900_9SPHN|nr:DUF559 domain-containing protein [Alteripontixanthobacter maritimus]RDC61194.1 Methionine synthase [Alteripontixanthobacter maritimus]
MTDRKTLSLDAGTAPNADPTAAWKISDKRAEQLKERARYNRRHPSTAHKALWAELDNKGVGNFAFSREVVMGSAIVDFACKTRWLVVEINGETEADTTIAALSDRKLTDVGVRVMRYDEADVLDDMDRVKSEILAELEKPFEKPRR